MHMIKYFRRPNQGVGPLIDEKDEIDNETDDVAGALKKQDQNLTYRCAI